MTLKTSVQSAVDTAFAKIDSLLVDAVFSHKQATGFDFSNGVVTGATSGATVRGFKENRKVWVNGSSVVKTVLLCKTNGIKFGGYTSVVIEGVTYGCSVLDGNDHVTTIELVGRV
jgi:hypothetical protein